MKNANKISPLFLLISFITGQQLENSTKESESFNLTLFQDQKLDPNTTETLTFQSSLPTTEIKNETEVTLNNTLLSEHLSKDVAEKPSSSKGLKNDSELLNSSLSTSLSLKSLDIVGQSSSLKEVNESLKLLNSNQEKFTNASVTSEGEQKSVHSQHTREVEFIVPLQSYQEIHSPENKTSEELKTSDTNQIHTILPFIHHQNHRLGVWKVPYEVLELDDDGSDLIKPATLVESKSFITNPEISTVRMNLALPETPRNTARIQRRYPSEDRGHPDYDKEEPYSSNESGEPGVHTETSEDYGRFLEDDYRKEIEKEAEAFVKRQKALNATKDNKPDSSEDANPEPNIKTHSGSIEKQYPASVENQYTGSMEDQHPGSRENQYPGSMENQHPGSMENQYPGSMENQYPGSMENQYPGSVENQYPGSMENQYPGSKEKEYPGSIENNYPESIESENGPGGIETDAQRGYFTSPNGNRQIETNSHQGYFTNLIGNKVFFYKGKQDSFNIEDVFPVIKFTRTHNQPLFFPENFYWPDVMNNPPKPFSPSNPSKTPPQISKAIDPSLTEQKNFHTNNEAPELHSKYPPPMEDSICSHDLEENEHPPKSYQEPMNQEYVLHPEPEQNYDADPQHSSEIECDESPHNYQDNGNYEHPPPFQPHTQDDPTELNGRGTFKTHLPANYNYEENNPQHDSNFIPGKQEHDEIDQYQIQQKYQAELDEKESSFRKYPQNTNRESSTQNSQEQIRTSENFNGSPPYQEGIYSPPFHHSRNPLATQNFVPLNHLEWTPINPHNNFRPHQNENSEPPEDLRVAHRNNNVFHPQRQIQEFIPPYRQSFVPSQVQNPRFALHQVGQQNFIPIQKRSPDDDLRIKFRPTEPSSKSTPDLVDVHRAVNYHNKLPSYHEHKQTETPRSVELAIPHSKSLVLKRDAENKNKSHPTSISSELIPLGSSEHQTKESVPKKKKKKSKRKSTTKVSKARKRNSRNSTIKRPQRQRKVRRTRRDDMKAEAATYHWGMEDHKNKDGFFMYVNNPHQDDYEYGYRVGGPQQTLERRHKTTGIRSTIKLNWEDQNGDSGDQYWEFNHTDEDATKIPLTAESKP